MTDEDTTLPGVSDESLDSDDKNKEGVIDLDDDTTISEENPSTLSARDEMMLEIAENAKKKRSEDEKQYREENDIDEPDIKPDDEEEPEPGDIAAELPETAETAEDDFVTVKIDGIESVVPKSDIDAAGGINNYQKQKAAFNRVLQAEALERQNAEREQNIAAREQAVLTRESQLTQQNTTTLPEQDDGEEHLSEEEIVEMLYSGDPEIAAKAVKMLRGRRPEPTTQPVEIDPNQIADLATQQALWVIEQNQATKAFERDYSEINANPVFRSYANDMTKRIKVERPNWGPEQIIAEAGEMAKFKFRDQLSKPESNTAMQTEQRVERKRVMDNVKGADTRIKSKPKKRSLTPSEIITNMNKGRSHQVNE